MSFHSLYTATPSIADRLSSFSLAPSSSSSSPSSSSSSSSSSPASSSASLSACSVSSSASSSSPSTSSSTQFPLLSLPADILRRILCYADPVTLCTLAQTCSRLRGELEDDRLWRYHAIRRFRVTPRVTTSRRLTLAGHVSWKTLYINWHSQPRMPVSRYSGPTFNSFAKGGSHGVLAWFTVTSSDDCRMTDGGVLRTRIIVQNACAQTKEKVTVLSSQVAVQVRDLGLFVATVDGSNNDGGHTWSTTSSRPNASMRARTRARARAHPATTQEEMCRVNMAQQMPIHFKAKHTLSQYESHQRQLETQREQLSLCENGYGHGSDPLMMSTSTNHRRLHMGRQRTRRDDALGRDDFLVMFVDVKIVGPDFEIEALERLEKVIVPVVVGGETVPIVCKLSDRIIWDAYELLPGGWWARVG